MKEKKQSKRVQNKGFTLIEVLIAMLVLAIIVTPFLRAFVTASKTNAKSRQLLRTTTISQNIMEEMKAYSLEDIARQFNGYGTDNSIVSNAESAWEATLNAADGTYTKVVTSQEAEESGGTVNASIIDAVDAIGTGKFVGQPTDSYHFLMSNVAMQSAKYDVAIHVEKNVNSGSYELVDITSMNRSDCAYFAQEKTQDLNVASEFDRRNEIYGSSAHAQLSVSEFQGMMSREITVQVSADAMGNENVKVVYDYSIPEGYTTTENRTYSEYTTIFDNYASGEELKAVYLYYYPLYGSTRTDTIKVENTSDLDIQVYLIKMKDADYNSFNDLDYAPHLKVAESTKADGDKSHTTICTNVNSTKMYKEYNQSGGTIVVKDLGNAETVDNFFDVTVEVFKHKADQTFASEDRINVFTGSLLNKGEK